MADNVAITAGTGTTVATDDISGVHYQRVKPTLGADGTAVDMSAGAGAVGTGVQRMTLASDDPAVVALQILDNAIAGNEMQVDVLTMPTVTVNSHAVTNAGTFAVQASLSAAVPAGTNNIGDIDVLTVPADPFGVNADAASLTTSISAKLRAIATALGTTAFDLGSGTGGTRTLRVMIDSASQNANGQTTAANSAPVVLSDYGKTALKSVTLSTDTVAYASGDLIADTQQIDAALRVSDGKGVLQSITIIDEDNQGVALYILIMRTSTSLGTENSVPNISDANLTAGLIGIVPVATTDYITLSGAKVACIKNIGLPIQAVTGTDDIYIAVLNATGTPTYTATGLEMVLGIQQD